MENQDLPYLIGIGASGSEGVTDIARLLAHWPEQLHAIALVVLHRPSDRVSHLSDVLQRTSLIPVQIATQGCTLETGVCYVGEPAKILSVDAGDAVTLLDGSDNHYRGRTIDLLFESLAAAAGRRAVGIVLSGALADGSRGLAAMHAAGGTTMVLEPGDKLRGMQQNAIDFDGPIDFIGSSTDIVTALTQICAQA